MTGDIDLLIEPTLGNAERTWAALTDAGYDMADLTPQDLLHYKVLIRQYILATDIHPSAKGVRFKTVWQNRVRDKIEGVPVFVASLDDLIRMKRAANRPKDREDLRALAEIRRRKRQTKK